MRFVGAAAVVALGAACSVMETGAGGYADARGRAAAPALVCPADGFTEVAADTPLFVRFSGPLDARTVVWGNIILGSGREAVRSRVRFDPALTTVYIEPFEPLRPGFRYDVYVTPAVRDVKGRAVVADNTIYGFRVGDPGVVRCPPDPRLPLTYPPDWCSEGDRDCPDGALEADVAAETADPDPAAP